MRDRHIWTALPLLLSFSLFGSAQFVNATLSGTVSDSTGALIPGVEITATHAGTGVVSTAVTNESNASSGKTANSVAFGA